MKSDPLVSPSLIEDLLGPLLTVTEDGTVLSWNKAAERVFAYTEADAIGKSYVHLLVPKERTEESRRWLKLALANGSATHDSVKRTKAGKLINVEVTHRVIGEPSKRTVVAINIRDIIQLKYLRQSKVLESRFRALLDAAPDAMIIIDPDGQIVLANRQAEMLFGHTREELLGMPVDILVPGRFHGRHEIHRQQFFKDPRLRPMGAGLELYGRRKDGKEFPVEISLSPLQTDDGLLVSSAIRDISDRKRAEEKFRALLESAPDAIVIINAGGQIVLVNAQAEKLFDIPVRRCSISRSRCWFRNASGSGILVTGKNSFWTRKPALWEQVWSCSDADPTVPSFPWR